jgi:hypothetical protein
MLPISGYLSISFLTCSEAAAVSRKIVSVLPGKILG